MRQTDGGACRKLSTCSPFQRYGADVIAEIQQAIRRKSTVDEKIRIVLDEMETATDCKKFR